MFLTDQMIQQNVENWLHDLAIGAKAREQEVMFAVPKREGRKFEVTASCYGSEKDENGLSVVAIHDLRELAESCGFELHNKVFTPADKYDYISWEGKNFIIYEDVVFVDYYGINSESVRRNRIREVEEYEKNARVQDSNSGTSDEVSLDNQ